MHVLKKEAKAFALLLPQCFGISCYLGTTSKTIGRTA
jgi:hypothetical protein